MSHLTALVAQIRGPRKRKPVPYPQLTRAQLVARMEAAERRCAVAAAKANDLGRDLHKVANAGWGPGAGPLVREYRSKIVDLSERAYAARDIALGDKPAEVVS